MKNKRIFIICLVLLLLFTSCSNKSEMSEAERFYREFMDATLVDLHEATIKYVHFEDERHLQWTLESETKIHSYEIIEVEQLSEQLWAFTVIVADDNQPQGQEGFNFVGIIDGQYRVMRNIDQIPPELKADVENIEDYQVQFETIPIDDVID